jgi:nucleotide-binding universal stress UspA family protein
MSKTIAAPKKILVPTDFSEASTAALDYAVELGKALGVPVHVMHAFELPIVGFPDGTLTITAEMASRIINAAQDALKRLVDEYATKKGVTLTTSLEQADPRDGIFNAAEKEQCDLIVMGTHGRRGIARALIGSVAESTVRRSTLPVLTIHSPKALKK